MASGLSVAAPALKKLVRATGMNAGNAFYYRRDAPTDVWCNPSVSTRDTLATCELETRHYFGPRSPANIYLRVRPAVPGRFFPTSCVVSLSTSSQSMDELAVQDVVVKEWIMNHAHCNSDWFETTIAVKTVYHIACLVGREPVLDARIFLTLRFVGCCDLSNTHQIAAVELLYTSMWPLERPPLAPETSDVLSTHREAVEVQLNLSPTPLRDRTATPPSVDRPFSSTSTLPLPPPLPTSPGYVVERTRIVHEDAVPRRSPPTLTSTPTATATNTSTSTASAVGAGSKVKMPSATTAPTVMDRMVEEDNMKGTEASSEHYTRSESCVLAEYEIESRASPQRRSVTLPRHKLFLDANDVSTNTDDVDLIVDTDYYTDHHDRRAVASHDASSGGVIELRTSPCTSPRSPPRVPPPPLPPRCVSSNTSSSSLPRFVESRVSMDDPLAYVQASPPPEHCFTSFIVPDRRDFVSIDSLIKRRPQESLHRAYLPWASEDGVNDHVTPGSVCGSSSQRGSLALAAGRRRIRSLRDVPVYEEQEDLLKAATELLGVDRESLCIHSSRASSSSRFLSSGTSVTSRRGSPSPRPAKAPETDKAKTPKQKRTPAPIPTPTPTPPPPPLPLQSKSEEVVPDVARAPGPSTALTPTCSGVQTPPRQRCPVTTTPCVSFTDTFKEERPWEEKKVPEVVGPQPLSDRTAEMNQLTSLQTNKKTVQANSTMPIRATNINNTGSAPMVTYALNAATLRASMNKEVPDVTQGANFVAKMTPKVAPLTCNTSADSSNESEGPSLIVQVEHPQSCSSTAVPKETFWKNSLEIAPRDENSVCPFIGTFLVWKHHVSRKGTAKRILTLRRDEDCVLVTLKRLDRGKKVSQVTLRSTDTVEAISGLRAYHSNAIHRDNVHMTECCLVMTRSSQLVAALEMESVSELRLATQILQPVCKITLAS